MMRESEWVKCTCGHYWTDHRDSVCDVRGCGCGAGLDDPTFPPGTDAAS